MASFSIDTLYTVFYINAAVWLVLFVYSVGVRKMPIYHPMFIYFVYHFIGFVLRPLNIAMNGFSYQWGRIGFSPTVGDLLFTSFVVNVAFFCVVVGSFLVRTPLKYPLLPPVVFEVRRKRLFYIVTFGVLALGMLSTMLSIGDTDQVFSYSVAIDEAGGRRLEGVSGYFTTLSQVIPAVCILLFLSPNTRKLALAVLVVFVGFRLYSGASRSIFVSALIGVVLIWHVNRGRRYPYKIAVLGGLVVAFAFEVIGADRLALRRVLEGAMAPYELFTNYLSVRGFNLLTSDAMEYDVATAVISVTNENNAYTFGSQFLRIFIWPIPRQLWPDKPVYTSIVDLNDYGFFRDLTVTFYADAYSVWSFFSLIFASVLLGVVMSKLYKIASEVRSVVSYSFFWIFVSYVYIIFRDGGVSVVIFWGTSMAAIFLIAWAGGLRICKAE